MKHLLFYLFLMTCPLNAGDYELSAHIVQLIQKTEAELNNDPRPKDVNYYVGYLDALYDMLNHMIK